MTLLLKQLDIHGFKSFATPTTFVFDRGITAVIGPNGSGKSNVAEALRWVLGEQGHANLRSRRTEDVIFAGSDKRAQLSMAEVTLTLDNSDGDLPLPFTEITVSRRAFRTGENHYLINGGRVRLKDVQQLVAPLGQSYTIIGQGLVDAALSQRPEERRGLFEHAAGISGLRMQANDAERSLTETTANAQRLRDILGELEPRVRSLERQARLAREYGTVRYQLQGLQRRHYAHAWMESRARMNAAREALRVASSQHEQLVSAQSDILRRLSTLRTEERDTSEVIRERTEQAAQQDRALAAERHRLDLLDTRSRATSERLADMRATVSGLEHQRENLRADVQRLEAETDELRVRLETLRAQLAERDAGMAAARERRAEMQQLLAEADQAVVDLTRQIAELEGQSTAVADHRRALLEEQRQIDAAITIAAQQHEVLERTRQQESQRASDLERQITAIEHAIERSRCEVDAARASEHTRRSAIEGAERELAALQSRLDILERTHANGEGLYAGVRAVMRAIRRGELSLPGFIGTVAETIDVPAEYETAIEVALGGHLQDIIVERWSDAQDAIAFLKRGNAGRATFQPLDTVRQNRAQTLQIRDHDIIGVAPTVITYPEQAAVVIEQLLGRTLIVKDLEASRRVLDQVSGWTIVTLAGELTRSSGSVTGGGRVAESGILARERDRRSLPDQIASRRNDLTRMREDNVVQASRLDSLIQQTDALVAELSERQREGQTISATVERARREATAVEETLRHQRVRLGATLERIQDLAQREADMRERLAVRIRQREDAHQTADRLRLELEDLVIENDDAAAALRSEIAGVTERLRATEASMRSAQERHKSVLTAIADRNTEIERIRMSSASETSHRDEIVAEIARLEGLVEMTSGSLPPLREKREQLAASITSIERELDQSTERVREAERERDRATLQLARAQDEQAFLSERIRNDLNVPDPATLERDEVADAPPPDEHEIARVRERLRRMSVVSDDVVKQYDAEAERLGFLSQQLADVDEAMAGLRRVLSELNTQMATRFGSTFRDVAVAFEQTFVRLFGGGSAKLVMSGGDDSAAGIDIVAQPPGKRLQNLNALSGGERALTAVALLIAIQRVNPSPFCLLDEVDAALDESNVIRFREEIRDLARSTQFVIITHNRGTIEGADTLFGVTMGDDGISRVLSLRLEDAIRAIEEFEVVETAD